MLPLIFGTLLALGNVAHSAPEIENLRRIYNLAPVSATNPVVARVKACGIEIPFTEFRGFVTAEGPLEPAARTLTPGEKRALLERLVDEHLLLWNAYEQKWDQKEGVVNMVNDTLNMILMETLTQKEVIEKAKTFEDRARLSKELRDQRFEKTKVIVSNESYEALKAAVKRLDPGTTGVSPAGTNPAATLNLPLANSELGIITVGNFLQVYTAIPSGMRPDLGKQESVIGILKEMWGDALLLAEARARGLHKTREVREGLQINRNVLTRFYAQDRITDQAVARLKGPDGEKGLRKWYEDHLKDRYTHKDEQGKEQIVSFEAERESIENDYFDVLREEVRAEDVRALRKGRQVEIDEELLGKLQVALQSSAPNDQEGAGWPHAKDAKDAKDGKEK